jgi:Rab guanine nucleotide exchange factor SEC2
MAMSMSMATVMASTKQLSHSHSTPQLSKAASTGGSLAQSPRVMTRTDTDLLNTIPDPRASTPSSTYSRNDSTDSGHHPDLSDEVATLSAKLVNAINNQTQLDDNLQGARHELDQANERIARLEAEARERSAQLQASVTRVEYERMEAELRKELNEEKQQRLFMEKEKKRIEAELENLTSALFEEANTVSLFFLYCLFFFFNSGPRNFIPADAGIDGCRSPQRDRGVRTPE